MVNLLASNWLDTAFAGVDKAVFSFYHSVALGGGKALTKIMEIISLFGKSGIFPLILAIVLLLFKRTRKIGLTALVAVGIGALITNVTLKPLIARPRPYLTSPYKEWWLYVGANVETDFSFPSGHVTAFASCMFAIFLSSKNKKYTWLVIIPAVLMGVSRNYLMVHYFTDVVIGYAVAGVASTAGYFIVKGLYALIYRYRDKKFNAFILNADLLDLFRRKKKMKVAIFIADGSEEIETLTPVDVLRRTNAECDIISVNELQVTCSHGVKITADKLVSEIEDFDEYDAIVIPGGMPGAINIAKCEKAVEGIKTALNGGKLVSAICASPAVVLAGNEILNCEKATCFPAQDFITALGEKYTGANVEVCDNVITANGPKSAMEFSMAICEYLKLTPKI